MKARLLQNNGLLNLLLCTGDVKNISFLDAKEFILTFDDQTHYAGPGIWDYEELSMEDFSGETIAVVDDEGVLKIHNAALFRSIVAYEPAKLLTVPEYAELHNKKTAIVRRFCLDGRIRGAMQKGTRWLIPADAPYPGEDI